MFTIFTGALGSGGMGGTIVMLLVMVGVFYFMLIRPENKRKKEAEQTRKLPLRECGHIVT